MGQESPIERSSPKERPHFLQERFSSIHKVELGIIPCILAAILTFHILFLLNAGALWRDEVHSAQFAVMPSISTVVSSLRFYPFPVGTTIILRMWTSLSSSDEGLRFFGLLVGLGIVGAIWMNSRMLGIGAPLLSMALFGFNQTAIRYGDSIRPHGLGTLFVVITFGLIWRVASV